MKKGYLKHRYGKEDISIDEIEKINSATLENKPDPFIDPAYKNYQFSYDDPRYSKFSDRISSTTPNKELIAEGVQSGGEVFWNTFKGLGLNTVSGYIGAVGSNDPRAIFNMATGRATEDYGNTLTRWAQGIREYTQEVAPIYNASDKMISGRYLGMQISNLGTTFGIMLEAFTEQALLSLTGEALSNAASATKSARLLSMVNAMKASKIAKASSKIAPYTFGMYQGVKEGHMNGLENYYNVYSEYIDKGRSEQEAEAAAKEAATIGFQIEVGPLMAMNAIRWAAIGGKYNPMQRGGLQAKGVSDLPGNIFSKMAPKGASLRTKKIYDYLGNMISESIEEGWQETTQSWGHYLTDKKRGYTEDKSLADYVFTTELRDSMIGGFLGGAVFKGMGDFIQTKKMTKDQRLVRKIMDNFIKTSTERANKKLSDLQRAESLGMFKKAARLKRELGFENTEMALMYDYMRGDEDFTAFNAQINSLKEIQSIIDKGDEKGLKMLGLADEKSDTGVNEYRYLKENLSDMIAEAEQHKADFLENLEFQMINFGEENLDIAQRTTAAQYMQRENQRNLKEAESHLEKLNKIEDGIYDSEQKEYRNAKAKLFALNSLTNELTPQLEMEKIEAENKIKELEERREQQFEQGLPVGELTFNEEGTAEKSFIGAHTNIAASKLYSVDIAKDIAEFKTGEGVQKFKDKKLKKKVDTYRLTNDVESLTEIKDILDNNERVSELYSKKELEHIKKSVEDKITKENSKTPEQKAEEIALAESYSEQARIREENKRIAAQQARENRKDKIAKYKKGDKITYEEDGQIKEGVITDDSRGKSGKYKVGKQGTLVGENNIKSILEKDTAPTEDSTDTTTTPENSLSEKEKLEAKLKKSTETIDKNLDTPNPVHDNPTSVSEQAARLANEITDDSNLLGGEVSGTMGIDDLLDGMAAPVELDEKSLELRNFLKNDAKNFLDRNPGSTFREYILSFVQNENVNKDNIDKLFYYYADGFFEAQNQRYTDNIEEVKTVYKNLIAPYNTFEVDKIAMELFEKAQKEEDKNQNLNEEEQKEVQEKIEKKTQENLEEESATIEIDEEGNPVKYKGLKTAAPYVNVPFSGLFYTVEYGKDELGRTTTTYHRDRDAEAYHLENDTNTLEGIKRAFMMDPEMAKAGVPVKVFIPSMQELMDDRNNFLVVDWEVNKEGVLEKKTILFSKWIEREDTETYMNTMGKMVTEVIDKSPGSKRFLEKVPIFMSAEINGQEVQMGAAIHETDWWNERNVADFEDSVIYQEALSRYQDRTSIEAISQARSIAKAKQDEVIRLGKEQTLATRTQIWENSKDTWESGERTEVGMKIKEVSDGLTLQIDENMPKRNIREANNDLMLGIVLEQNGESQFVVYSDEGGSYDILPKSRIFNSAILDEVAKPGHTLSAIPFRTNSDGDMMYLLQMVDTGYEGAQKELQMLDKQAKKISNFIEAYQKEFAKDRDSTPTKNLRAKLEKIFEMAGTPNYKGALNAPGTVGYGSALEKFAFHNLLKNYPRKNKKGTLSVSFNKDNVSGKKGQIVIIDNEGNPSLYKPNPNSDENSILQMLKENIYTNHDYIEIRDLQKEDVNATKKVANVQPRVHLEFTNEISKKQADDKLKLAEEEARRKASEEAKKKIEEEAKRKRESDEPVGEFKLSEGQKYTILNNLFHKLIGSDKFKSDTVSRKDIAEALRTILEETIADLKESNPNLYNYLMENKDSIIGLADFKDASGTLREIVQEHFNIDSLIELDESDVDAESTLEKVYSKTAQENDVRTSISSKLKRFFSGIPAMENRRRGEAVDGMVEYMELDDVFAVIQDLLADAPNNFEVFEARIKERMELNPVEFGFLEHILARVTDAHADKQIQREILFKLNQTKNRMFFVYAKDNRGKYVLQVYDANSRQPLINIKNVSTEQLKTSPLIERLDGNNYKIIDSQAERAIKQLKTIRESKEPLFRETRDILSEFGINVEESTLEALYNKNKAKYNNNIENLLRTLNVNLLNMKGGKVLSFDNKRENLLLNNNNNYLNNFLGDVIKVTFNIDQSMSVAGKTINAFSQPNYFSEQVRKLLSLKGKDLDEGSKHLAKQLLESGYSKNSLLLNLITERNRFDGSLSERARVILEEMFVGYTSLDVLKRKDGNSQEQGLSDLSPSDYDTAIMGFFGDMSKRINGQINGINLRMASMTSPTLSDSSQMILFNTVALDLNETNLNFSEGRITGYNENVAKVLYEQLVLPEITRAIEVKGSERDIISNQMIYSIPAVNAIEVDGKTLHNFIRVNNITEKYTQEKMLEDINRIFGAKINEAIKNTITNEVQQKLKVHEDGSLSGSWIEDGFLVQNKGQIKSEILDSEFLLSKFKDGSDLGRTEVAVWDFVINYYITQAQMQMLFAGDISNYSKARADKFELNSESKPDIANIKTKNNTVQEKVNAYVEISKATSENLSKRLKAQISPGNRIAFSQGQQYIQLMMEDSIEISTQYKKYLESWYKNKDISESDIANIDYILETSEQLKRFEGRLIPQEGTDAYNDYQVDLRMYEAQKAKVKEIVGNLKTKYPDIAGYLENASTDAQEYTTWQEHLDVSYNMGKLTEQQYNEVRRKLNAQSKGIFNEDTLLSIDEKIIFQPMKPLHSGMYFREMDNGNTYQEFVYVKSSSFPLIPEMTRNMNLENLRKNMEAVQEKNPGMNVRASYQTANKVGGVSNPININKLLDNEAVDDLTIKNSSIILDRDNFSIQQEKPFKTDKNILDGTRDEVGRGTQIEKILLGNGINKETRKIFPNLFGSELLSELDIQVSESGNISGEDLYKIFTDISVKEQGLKREQFLRSLDIDPNDFQLGSIKSMESLQSALSKRLPNKQDKEILELKYYVKDENGNGTYHSKADIDSKGLEAVSAEFTFPIWLSPNSRKFESVLNSMVTNEFIKLKLPGNSFPVASEIGFRPNKTLDQLSESEKMGIVYTDSYNGQELLPERIENGKTLPAQVLIASKFRRKVVNPITKVVTEEIIDFNSPEYINPETGRIDSNKVPREVLELFSFRIPTSAHQSGSIVEIVGFLPHSSGDLMVVPNEHTTKIGEDYDIDTRYTYSGNYIVGEDGTIKLLKKEDVPSYPREEIDNLYKEYQEYKDELYKEIQSKNPNRPSGENRIKTEIASTNFLIKVLETKKNPLLEDTQEIQALKEELLNLEASLGATSDDFHANLKAELKTLHDNFIANKEIRVQEFLDARRQTGNEINVLENEMINLYKSIYLSNDKDVQKLITTTINTDMAENTAKLMDAKINSSDQSNFSLFGYEHQKAIMRLGSSGKLGIGVHSNWVVWNGLIQQSQETIAIEGLDLQIGYFKSDGTLGNIKALTPQEELIPPGKEKEYESFQPRMISEINMENQNSATDNQKLQIMGKRNENKFTINVFALMNNLGFDKDIVNINGNNTEMLVSSLFINQPIIRRYVALKEKYASTFAEYNKDVENKIFAQLKEEFGANVNFAVSEKTGEVLDRMNEEALQEASENMTGQTLYDSLITPTDANTQWAVFEKFNTLQEHAVNVNKVIQLMNIDKGLGISYFNVLAKKNMLISEMSSEGLGITNVESLFGEEVRDEFGEKLPVYETDVELIEELLEEGFIQIGSNLETGEVFIRKPNSPNSAKLLNSISMGYYLWGNVFPFENKYFSQQIDDILGATNKVNRYDNAVMETRYDILVGIRDYMYSLNNLGIFKHNKDGNINTERRRLLIDDKDANKESLAGYLLRLKKESKTNPELAKLFGKSFFRNLEYVINKGEPSLIKYSINNTNSFNKNLPHTELEMLSKSQEILPAFNGDNNYTHEKLVDDLVRYSLLNNVENGAIGFRNYIPMSVFKKHGLDTQLTSLANMQVGGGRFFNILYNGTLKAITSFMNNENYLQDNSGMYLEIPSTIMGNEVDMNALNKIVNNVNRTLGADTVEIEGGSRIRINKNPAEIDKSRFVRQFYQHNPDHAYRVEFEKTGLKRNEINFANDVEVIFGEESLKDNFTIPKFITIRGGQKQTFLYELVQLDDGLSGMPIKYKKINKLGGFGINEFNPHGEVNQSLFEENNIKEVPANRVPVPKRNTTSEVNSSIFNLAVQGKAEALSISQVAELFNKENLDVNNEEVRRLKAILDNLLDFVDPSTKVYSGHVPRKSPGMYSPSNNTITLDTKVHLNPNSINRMFRVFVEEVVHSITGREIESYINPYNTKVVINGDDISLSVDRVAGRSSAAIEKLLQLYKKTVEHLVEKEVIDNNREISKQKAFDNIINRNESLDTTGYRIQNLHEFVAGVFSDGTFRKQTNEIQYRETNTSILKQFADFVGRILKTIKNRVNESVTEQTITATVDLIGTIPTEFVARKGKFFTREVREALEKRARSLINSTKIKDISDNTLLNSITREQYLEGKLSEQAISELLSTNGFTLILNGKEALDLMELRDEITKKSLEQGGLKKVSRNPNNLTVGDIQLNDDQQRAYEEIMDFLKDPSRSTHSLIGYAGTGKTTLLNIIESSSDLGPFANIVFTSPTHRANAVIRLKNPGATVHTLHSLLGLSLEQDLDTFDLSVASFKPKNDMKMENGDIIIIDESSMINDSLFEIIKKVIEDKNAKVLFVGDDAQIKPVKQVHKSKALTSTENISTLNIVERANNNSLLEESMLIRETGDFSYQTDMKDNKGISFTKDVSEFLTKAFDMFKSQEFKDNPLLLRILSGTNAMVESTNAKIRAALFGKNAQEYLPGDVLMGYSNWKINYQTKLPTMSNGGDYVVNEATPVTRVIAGMEVDGFDLVIENLLEPMQTPFRAFILSKNTDGATIEAIGAKFEEIRQRAINLSRIGNRSEAAKAWRELSAFKDSFMTPVNITYKGYTKIGKTLDYGYSHTIHKSQGGTYKYSFILDDTMNAFKDNELKSQLKYVAATRAEEGTFVLTSKDIDQKTNIKEEASIEENISNINDSSSSNIDINTLKQGDTLTLGENFYVRIHSVDRVNGTADVTMFDNSDGYTSRGDVQLGFIEQSWLTKESTRFSSEIELATMDNFLKGVDRIPGEDMDGNKLTGNVNTFSPDLSTFEYVEQDIFENCKF